ncbi:MAG: hypothetical protein AAGA60_18875 [Cyanobacteria bacterium P01_E01_bin.42]
MNERQATVIGEVQVRRNRERPERTAREQVRAMALTLEVPQHHLNKALKPITLNILLVEETVPPEDGEKMNSAAFR